MKLFKKLISFFAIFALMLGTNQFITVFASGYKNNISDHNQFTISSYSKYLQANFPEDYKIFSNLSETNKKQHLERVNHPTKLLDDIKKWSHTAQIKEISIQKPTNSYQTRSNNPIQHKHLEVTQSVDSFGITVFKIIAELKYTHDNYKIIDIVNYNTRTISRWIVFNFRVDNEHIERIGQSSVKYTSYVTLKFEYNDLGIDLITSQVYILGGLHWEISKRIHYHRN